MKTDSPRAVNQATFAALANGVTLMQANFADHSFERHSHDCFAIGLTTHGVQRFRCKGKQHDSQVGDFVLLNPDQDHDGNPGTDDGFAYTIWYVPDDFVSSCVAAEVDSDASRYFARPHVADRHMAATFKHLSASLAGVPSESLRVESLMRAFLATMLSRHGERPGPAVASTGTASGASLERVKDYIRTCFQSDITVSDLATVAGLSRAHLTRAFSAAYHVPPHIYLNAVRVARAKTLIRLGMPLAAVAVECGFGDQSHLARRFKGSIGVTPSVWREQMRQ
jgi:AraC-like DNA-binding protein